MKKILQTLSLQNRLLFLFILLLILSITAVGLSTYQKAKETTIDSVQHRLVREVELMAHIAKNLKFTYISDQAYFWQQLEIHVRAQQEKLREEGLTADFFYITKQEITPFKVSKDQAIPFPENVMEKLLEEKVSLFQENINGDWYTLSAQYIDELEGHYLLLVPTKSYMSSVEQMAQFMLMTMLISIVTSIILIIIFVRSLTNPLTQLRQQMREVRQGRLVQSEEI